MSSESRRGVVAMAWIGALGLLVALFGGSPLWLRLVGGFCGLSFFCAAAVELARRRWISEVRRRVWAETAPSGRHARAEVVSPPCGEPGA